MRKGDGKNSAPRYTMKIGVLDIQGSVGEHVDVLKRLGSVSKISIEPVLVKNISDLDDIAGLIIPGGESTTIGKLIKKYKLRDVIIARAQAGMPIWGTCAGAILLAKKNVDKTGKEDQKVESLKLMNIAVERNSYGRQLDSFETEVEFDFGKNGAARLRKISAVFIRAPKIVSIGKDVKILAKYRQNVVAMKEGNLLATLFHPEITGDFRLHRYFVKNLCRRG